MLRAGRSELSCGVQDCVQGGTFQPTLSVSSVYDEYDSNEDSQYNSNSGDSFAADSPPHNSDDAPAKPNDSRMSVPADVTAVYVK